MLKTTENHIIKLQDILGGVHHAELRDQRVVIDGAEVADLQAAPGGDGIYIILANGWWPIHVTLDRLQPLAPIALYLPGVHPCMGCQSPVVCLQLPPPDEKWCPSCAAIQAQEGAAWERQRAEERRQIAALDRMRLEALYQQAKAHVQRLPYGSQEWHRWRRIQIDPSMELADR